MSLAVDGHRVRSAMAVAHRALFSWQLPTIHLHAQDGGGSSSAACARQSGYQVRITGGAGRVVLLDTGRVNSTMSDGVRLPPIGAPPLPPMRELEFYVRVWAGSSNIGSDFDVAVHQQPSTWSRPYAFASQMPSSSMTAVFPLWAAPPAADVAVPTTRFALLRGVFDCTWAREHSVFLALSAKPTPNWKADAPRGNASKLLGAYKAWVNGVPLGMGPGRTYAQGVGVDVFNISDLLRCGSSDDSTSGNVLAVQAFYQPLGFPGDNNNTDDSAGVWAAMYDGANGKIHFSTGPQHLAQWRAFDAADAAFGITGSPGCAGKCAWVTSHSATTNLRRI